MAVADFLKKKGLLMKIIYGAAIFLVIFCVSFAYGVTNHPDATGHETLKNTDKPSDHFTKPIILTLAQADKNATDDQKPLYHFGIPPYQRGQRVDEIRDQYKPFLVRLPDQALTFSLGIDTNPVNQWIKNLIISSISGDFSSGKVEKNSRYHAVTQKMYVGDIRCFNVKLAGTDFFISGAALEFYGLSGGPISGVFTGAASPINTTSWWPPGFVGAGTISQLLANHTFPEGSIWTPVFRTRPSNV